MDIYNLYPGSWNSNCYVLIGDEVDGQRRAAVVDPSADAREIVQLLNRHGAKLDFIILTHGHFDHIISLDELRDMTGAPAYIHKDDDEMLPDGEKNAYSFFFGFDKKWRPAERCLDHGDELTLGKDKLKVISTPGHSKGAICLLGDGFLITGDTLFAQGYGRYDLHGGNAGQLANSLASLRDLDHDLLIYPGHGDSAKLGDALNAIMYM
ncbi:MAG: MBL fold metallo-hydrolase [Clostridia bacterium]|nr:MBL fold metallo-hydrolase [Clostridia bacterium]